MWQGILGHDAVAERFRATLRRDRLASTHLFVGPSGIGKKKFAMMLAKALLCSEVGEDPLDASQLVGGLLVAVFVGTNWNVPSCL